MSITTPCIEIERSIQKKFRKSIWRPFITGIKRYSLIKEGDRIACCISGGKDSMLLAKLMQFLHKYSDVPFDLEFIVMDPGFNEINRQKIISNADLIGIPIKIFESDIFKVVSKTDRCPCYLCARMRRGYLYSFAKELSCNKIALGHHFSDVVETILMNMLYGYKIQCMMPKLKSQNYPGIELIRPMYCVHEDAITAWKRYNNLNFISCGCPLSENCNIFDASADATTRQKVKSILKELKKDNKDVENSIFESVHRINLHTVPSYTQNGQEHNFLDDYDL